MKPWLHRLRQWLLLPPGIADAERRAGETQKSIEQLARTSRDLEEKAREGHDAIKSLLDGFIDDFSKRDDK
jgi:hypothetical protein